MTDTPDPLVTITDRKVENSLLRGSLWLTARRLEDYQDCPARQLDNDHLQLTIPRSLREKAAEALERAQALLVLGR